MPGFNFLLKKIRTMQNKIKCTLLFSIFHFSLHAQSASQAIVDFFDKQTIVAMIIGAIVGGLSTRYFSKKSKD